MMEILRILNSENKVLGAKHISDELKKRGYSLGERAVRYHMRILDEKGFTEKVGHKGRIITQEGINELNNGLIFDQVDFAYSRFQEKMYNISLDLSTAKGLVIANISSVNQPDAKKTIESVFEQGLAVSKNVIYSKENGTDFIKTVCGTTIDGVFQKNGIISRPSYGGLVKVEDNVPIEFIEQIAYEKTSITPLEAFSGRGSTSVLDVVSSGDGIIPANFRIIPMAKEKSARELLLKLNNVGIGGLIKMGKPGESVLGISVPEGMIGVSIIGGIAPLCAAQEDGYDLNIKLADEYVNYESMQSLNYNVKPLLSSGSNNTGKISFVLEKIFNLMSQVTFDHNTFEGDIITNVSYVDKKNLDESLEIINQLYKEYPHYFMGDKYALLEDRDDKIGIATICSLTVDGILTNNAIVSIPIYSGVLDMNKRQPRFIELISYKGSSVDPHEIFIKKDMCDLSADNTSDKILASVHSVPYVARDDALDIFDSIATAGFNFLEVGKPNEYIYNSKIDMYHFGYATAGGLNPIEKVKESGVCVDVKSIEKIMDFKYFETF